LIAAGAECVVPPIRGHDGWRDHRQLQAGQTYRLSEKKAALMSIHLFGSCPMGEASEFFPVDSFGRLVGMKNIIVADGSVLPGAPGVNPQATIMALAFRAVDAFVADRRVWQ
jgi:choline dehydrogenase-like flavoprotein